MDGVKNILFVCQGNTCRSPMAKGLALHYFQNSSRDLSVDSAGISESSKKHRKATPEAVTEMKKRGFDLSTHRAKHVSELKGHFDFVISMTPSIHDYLKKNHRDLGEKFIAWNIPDPYDFLGTAQAAKVYADTAESIWEHFRNFVNQELW